MSLTHDDSSPKGCWCLYPQPNKYYHPWPVCVQIVWGYMKWFRNVCIDTATLSPFWGIRVKAELPAFNSVRMYLPIWFIVTPPSWTQSQRPKPIYSILPHQNSTEMGQTPAHSSLPRLNPNTLPIHTPLVKDWLFCWWWSFLAFRYYIQYPFEFKFKFMPPVRFQLTYLVLFHFSTIQ